jgi:hypothetical protein
LRSFDRGASARERSHPADELNRAVRQWRSQSRWFEFNPYRSIFEYVHPLVVGALDRASSLSIKLCTEILLTHMQSRYKARRISNIHNNDYPSHSYPITIREARRIGLHVTPLPPEINGALIRLNDQFSELGADNTHDFNENFFADRDHDLYRGLRRVAVFLSQAVRAQVQPGAFGVGVSE